ncbi:hypothetical protein BH10PLA2_BH10PLA2_10810 [soil metagenome]
MRPEVLDLAHLGRLPNSSDSVNSIKAWQLVFEKIQPPVSDEEARILIKLLPADDDDCFGLAWSLIHLIETSPKWPLKDCLTEKSNPWIELLRIRLQNGGIILSE